MKTVMSSIRGKFIFVVSIIFIMLTVLSLFIVFMTNRLADFPTTIITHPLQVSNAAFLANIEMLRIEKNLNQIMLSEEDYEINLYEDRIRVSEGKVYASLTIIGNEILGAEGKDLYEEAIVLFDEWIPIRSEVIQAVREGNKTEALRVKYSTGEVHSQNLERKLIELNQYARNRANEFNNQAIALEESTKIVSITGMVFFALGVLLCMMWIGFNVLGGIRSLSDQVEDILESDKLTEVELQGNNELVQLSKSFNALIKSLKRQLWIKEGNQKLYGILGDSQRIEHILNDYLHEITTYAGLISAAIYVLDGLELTLSGVENRLSFMKDAYPIGVGYVGECAERKVEKHIDYSDNVYGMSSDMPIGSIFVKPIEYNTNLFGVLVLISYKKVSSRNLEYITSGIKDLSIFLERQSQNKKIDQLLQKSIQSNEELTDRQQKLEENQQALSEVNTELEAQRDLLNKESDKLMVQNKELLRLREELESKYKDLETSTKYRSQFIANVSHELRTPLNSIIILSDLLTGKSLSDYQEEDIEKIIVVNRAAKELLVIINNILDLSKIESGKVEVHNEIFLSRELMESLKVIFRPMMTDKSLTSEFRTDGDHTFYGDIDKVYHIVSNLISNAIKFTSEGSIIVSLRVDRNNAYPIRIDVEDSGIGISQEKMEDIFDEFVQSDGTINRKFGGTGLGLAICRNYANLIGATIEVQSDFGKGSTFSLMLPDAYLVKNTTSDMPTLNRSYIKTEIPDDLTAPLKGKKALVCDDEPLNIFALSSLLEDVGLEIYTALNYEDAMAVYEHHDLDIILMDVMIPDKDGLTILSDMRSLSTWKETPIVIITASNLTEEQLEDIKHEGYQLIKKPILNKEVIRLLNELLS